MPAKREKEEDISDKRFWWLMRDILEEEQEEDFADKKFWWLVRGILAAAAALALAAVIV